MEIDVSKLTEENGVAMIRALLANHGQEVENYDQARAGWLIMTDSEKLTTAKAYEAIIGKDPHAAHPSDSPPIVALFKTGEIVMTPGARKLLDSAGLTGLEFFARHVRGDWGDLDDHDKQANADALRLGNRILSNYFVLEGDESSQIWIITERNRDVTTILLPEEY